MERVWSECEEMVMKFLVLDFISKYSKYEWRIFIILAYKFQQLITYQAYIMGCVATPPQRHHYNANQKATIGKGPGAEKSCESICSSNNKYVKQQESTQLSHTLLKQTSFCSNQYPDSLLVYKKNSLTISQNGQQNKPKSNQHLCKPTAEQFVSDDLDLRQTFIGSTQLNEDDKIKIKRYEQGLSIISEANSKQQNSFYTPKGLMQSSLFGSSFKKQIKNQNYKVNNQDHLYWGPAFQHQVNLRVIC